MWRTLSRPASAVAVVAALALAGCGTGDRATSAGADATPPTSGAPIGATLPAPTTATAPSTTAPRCANVTFSGDDVASDIRGTGLSCTEAEALVQKLGPQLASADGPARVETDGVVCIRTSLRSGDHGPPLATFECTSGGNKVTFMRALSS
jgi:hypothetical protein